MNEREKMLNRLLVPISIDYRSSISARQKHVQQRRSRVRIVMPFLNKKELIRAEQWLIEESHSDL